MVISRVAYLECSGASTMKRSTNERKSPENSFTTTIIVVIGLGLFYKGG